MLPQPIAIFVYGTLKPGFPAYEPLCGRYPHEVQPAIALGRLYHLPLGFPAMTLESGRVKGYCLTFRDPQILPLLDDYEQHDWQDLLKISPQHPWGNEYERSRLTLYSPLNAQLGKICAEPLEDCLGDPLGEAWVYIMTREKIQRLQGRWIPNGKWIPNGE
ncbi:MAG: gamma-glutamylcyclotransferase [Synechococcales bacterium]|nr:gamma-glutamylcyclotransferase [Synechococcales bacterium]